MNWIIFFSGYTLNFWIELGFLWWFYGITKHDISILCLLQHHYYGIDGISYQKTFPNLQECISFTCHISSIIIIIIFIISFIHVLESRESSSIFLLCLYHFWYVASTVWFLLITTFLYFSFLENPQIRRILEIAILSFLNKVEGAEMTFIYIGPWHALIGSESSGRLKRNFQFSRKIMWTSSDLIFSNWN